MVHSGLFYLALAGLRLPVWLVSAIRYLRKRPDISVKSRLVGKICLFSEVALPRFGKHKLEKLFEIRNAIAHKKKASATGSEASSAIRVALELKELLHNLK